MKNERKNKSDELCVKESDMSNEYELESIKDIFDKIPTDKVDLCLSELGDAIKQAQGLRDALEGVADVLTGDRNNMQAIWPAKSNWIDDDKGEVTVNATIELCAGDHG